MLNPYDINESHKVMAEYGEMLAVVARRYGKDNDKKRAASTISAVREDMNSYMSKLQNAVETGPCESGSMRLACCPFCGKPVLRKERDANPIAWCATSGCMGGGLPVLKLDNPKDVARWNTRAI